MFKGLTELLKYFRDERHWESERKEAALNAIRDALQETKAYITLLNNGSEKDKAKELELSNLWSIASIAARHIDRELAKRLGVKGNYWLESETWSLDDIYDANIKLERIDAELSEMLGYLP